MRSASGRILLPPSAANRACWRCGTSACLRSTPPTCANRREVCLHHLLRLELPQTVDALEALLFAHNDETYQPLLGEQCARVGQLYAELKRRAGAVTALLILQGELRLLRYRASPERAPLVFSWGRCDLSSSV